MAKLESFEVIMKIDFGANDGITAVAHAEKVAELVRCKDCVAYGEMRPGRDTRMICNKFALNFPPDFFCADGERRK